VISHDGDHLAFSSALGVTFCEQYVPCEGTDGRSPSQQERDHLEAGVCECCSQRCETALRHGVGISAALQQYHGDGAVVRAYSLTKGGAPPAVALADIRAYSQEVIDDLVECASRGAARGHERGWAVSRCRVGAVREETLDDPHEGSANFWRAHGLRTVFDGEQERWPAVPVCGADVSAELDECENEIDGGTVDGSDEWSIWVLLATDAIEGVLVVLHDFEHAREIALCDAGEHFGLFDEGWGVAVPHMVRHDPPGGQHDVAADPRLHCAGGRARA
jgi:hypothetical protein